MYLVGDGVGAVGALPTSEAGRVGAETLPSRPGVTTPPLP